MLDMHAPEAADFDLRRVEAAVDDHVARDVRHCARNEVGETVRGREHPPSIEDSPSASGLLILAKGVPFGDADEVCGCVGESNTTVHDSRFDDWGRLTAHRREQQEEEWVRLDAASVHVLAALATQKNSMVDSMCTLAGLPWWGQHGVISAKGEIDVHGRRERKNST